MAGSFNKFMALALCATALTPVAAIAQEAADESGASEERRFGAVVVTAQRREENLLDVPLSVSAFDGELLSDLGIQTMDEVAKISPNVTLEVSRGTNNTLSAFIRGVGQQDPVSGFESGVGIYVDDVYLNRPQGAVLEVYDVERIEVLRGPQGTLYGRNTIGGAVKYVTKGLSDDPTLKVRGALGSYNQRDIVANASTPLTDNLRVGAGVAFFTRDGFGENLITGEDNYNKDVAAYRLSAEWDVTDKFQIRVAGDYMSDESNARQGHRMIPDLSAPFEYPVLNNVYDTRAGLNAIKQNVDVKGGSIVAQYELNDNITLKNILAYREDEGTSPIDFDSLPEVDVDVPAIYTNDQLSNEFQISYSSDRLNGIVGAYYLEANSDTVFDVGLFTTGELLNLINSTTIYSGYTAQTYGDVGTNTWSIFADFTYDLTDQFSIALGGRYTEDKRSSTVLRRTYLGGFSEFFGGNGAVAATISNFTGSETFDDFSPRASLTYKPVEDHTLYATYSQGFKGGSFDPRGVSTLAIDLDQSGSVTPDEVKAFMLFEPEEVDSYEIGWKSNLFDNRLQSSLAVFYMDYKDVQIPGSVGVDANNDGVFETFAGVTTNAGAATLWGVEYEGTALLGEKMFNDTDMLTASTSIGYINAEYDEFIAIVGGTAVNLADQRVVQNTPEWTGSLRFSYDTPFNILQKEGRLIINQMTSYRGDSSQFEIPSAIDQEAYTLVDLSLRWQETGSRWGFNMTAKNLTDERYRVSGYNFINPVTGAPSLGLEGVLTGFYGDPRTFTFGIDYTF
ncbi:TonB-dependent receptor [Hyphomonas sp. WL0036]|uniref:TonB-dependent receptor n=1 Tax=Hyphomonas sediminis TaxID=2866160 RepID=UPI001C802858|nr:TonB-dependent receptor [Hyphomonas sediminis]MBY9066507.1 TonB-dependent receptor [Hyphomonas sediminis]